MKVNYHCNINYHYSYKFIEDIKFISESIEKITTLQKDKDPELNRSNKIIKNYIEGQKKLEISDDKDEKIYKRVQAMKKVLQLK